MPGKLTQSLILFFGATLTITGFGYVMHLYEMKQLEDKCMSLADEIYDTDQVYDLSTYISCHQVDIYIPHKPDF